jgi:hypothetical protein
VKLLNPGVFGEPPEGGAEGKSFGAEPEADKYGIANAMTRAAQKEENWEKSLEMERIGGKLITLASGEFKRWND